MVREIFKIASGNFISIIGVGGKTSLLFLLARELSKNKVLVTTTTKIYVPHKDQYDFLAVDQREIESYKKSKTKGIYVFGKGINAEGKLMGMDCDSLGEMTGYFDYILVEADGSKNKPLKGWRYFEPLVCDFTDKTIGIIDIKAVGERATAEKVFCLDEFRKLCGIAQGEIIDIDHFFRVIMHPSGLFKKAVGEKILFINKVENRIDKKNCDELVKKMIKVKGNIDHIISGSIKNEVFTLEYSKAQ